MAKINLYKTAGKRPNRRYRCVRGGRPWEVEKRTFAGDLLQNTRSEEGILKIERPECTRQGGVNGGFLTKNHTPPLVSAAEEVGGRQVGGRQVDGRRLVGW